MCLPFAGKRGTVTHYPFNSDESDEEGSRLGGPTKRAATGRFRRPQTSTTMFYPFDLLGPVTSPYRKSAPRASKPYIALPTPVDLFHMRRHHVIAPSHALRRQRGAVGCPQ